MRAWLRPIMALGAAAMLLSPAQAAPFHPPIPPGLPQAFYAQTLQSQVATAFLSSDYDWLDATAQRFRDSGSRTPSGDWDLEQFYDALNFTPTQDGADDERKLADFERKAGDWARAYPASPAPYILYARLLVNHGCVVCLRGYGPEAWKSYQNYLGQARDYLMLHKDVADKDPHWYVTMMEIARGQKWEPTIWEPLLNEGLERFPGYYRLYHEGAAFHTPFWGGNVDDLDTFVDSAIARTHKTDGLGLYARIYGHVGFGNYQGRYLFAQTHATAARLLGSYMELTGAHPDPWIYEEMFFYACVAGDQTAAKLAFGHLMPMRRPDVWSEPADFAACSTWVADKSGAPSPLQALAAPRADPMAPTEEQAVYLMLASAAVIFLIMVRAVV